MADVNVSASQTVTVSELVEMFLLSISTSDSVSVLESVTAVQVDVLKQHDAIIMPVRRLYGEFLRVFSNRHLGVSVPLRIPARTGLGYFGARLSEERIPTRELSANIADPSIGLVGGVNASPVWSCTGRFGGRLESRIPVRTLSASFDLAGILSLDSVIPVRSFTGTFKPPSSFTLSRQIPIWMGEGNMVLTEPGASLSVKIPGAFIFTGEMHEVGGFRLACNIPVRRLESSIYASSFVGDAEIPIPVPVNLIVSQHTRFSDYVLRYSRP